MFKSKYLLLIFTIGLCQISCNTTKATVKKDKKISVSTPLSKLVNMMIGSYDSSEQAANDESYYDITLHMYPIWTQRSDAKYLYVEQSVTTNEAKPYRQRIYKIEDNADGSFSSYIYKIKHDSIYIGKWKDLTFFESRGNEILELREGCEVILKADGAGGYSGSTIDNNCKSTLRGANYATSIVDIKPGEVKSWDQGFDDKGEQVWGY